MPQDALIVFVVLGAALVLFASDRLRLDEVALLALLSLAATSVVPLGVVLSGFSSPAVLMIAGLFVVGAAIAENGVADWLGRRIDAVAGESEPRVIAVVMGATALVSAFMSSTGTVAILMPIVGSIANRRGIAPGRLLMPLAFGAHLGSNLTLISTPPNLLVSDALREAGHAPFRFFSFLVPGVATLFVGVAYVALVGRRALPVGDPSEPRYPALSLAELAQAYGLVDAVSRVRVVAGSALAGRTIAQANLRAGHGITILGIVRDGAPLRVVPAAVLEAGDELRVIGDGAALESLRSSGAFEPVGGEPGFSLPPEESVAEVVLPRRSRLAGRTLKEARFRDRYRATVLALRRAQGSGPVCHVDPSLRDLTLEAGDTLLVKSRRKYLRNLRDDRDNLVLVAEPDATPGAFPDRKRGLGTIAITLAMLVVMAFGWLPNVVAVLAAALSLVITRCVRPSDAYRSVGWESIVLVAGMIPLALALEQTGGTAYVVKGLERALSGAPPIAVLALVASVTSAFGMVLSNTATAVLLAPIALRLADAFDIAPEPLLMGVAFGASAAFATPIASPVNALVVTPGGYRFGHFVRVGLPLQLLVLTTAVLVIPLAWPF